jgi:LysM repeat protein
MVDDHSPGASPLALRGRRVLHAAESAVTAQESRDDAESITRAQSRTGHHDLVALYARRMALLAAARPGKVESRTNTTTSNRWSMIEPVQFGKSRAERNIPTESPEPEFLQPVAAAPPVRPSPFVHRDWQFRFPARLLRLVTAAFLASILIAGTPGQSLAQERYRVKSGDTLDSVATEFGVDPEAILRSSWMENPPNPAPGDVLVIPDPGQSPSEAADEAAQLEGTSPWVSAAYYVQAGDSIDAIAAAYGVDPDALLSFNNLTWSAVLEVGQRILIPASREEISGEAVDDTPAQTDAAASQVDTQSTLSGSSIWVPAYVQQRNLSCEYASAYIATAAFGDGIPEWAFWENIPVTLNPHYGYRGDIDGWWGNYDDYGIYPEPLVPILNAYGFAGDVFYSEGDTSQLTAELDAGHPVIVWLSLWGNTGVVYDDEGTYTVFAGEHVMAAYAYDQDGVSLSDPATGSYVYYDWSTFIGMWAISDGMSLAVYPS